MIAHTGWGDWIIVDSCVGPDGQTPIGLSYLEHIGVDASKAVERIVTTHWHNDHVRGLAQTMHGCAAAKFICSQALLTKEFIALTDLWKRQRVATSPLSEMTGVLDIIAGANSVLKSSSGDSRLGFAMANKCLWRRSRATDITDDTSAELHSLSPSDAAVKKSLESIAQLFPGADMLTQPLPTRPNQFSVAHLAQGWERALSAGGGHGRRAQSLRRVDAHRRVPERPDGEASLYSNSLPR